MRQPEVPPSLAPLRQGIVVAIAVAAGVTIWASIKDGVVMSHWTNAIGVLLGGLAGSFIGEHLERFGERIAATQIAWLQMALIALLFVAVITWQALPAYCQLPVSFAIGIVVVAATVYIQRLRMRLP
jgi:CDP-archaeol synthase